MNDIVDLIVNNGIAVVVVAYFLFRDYKFNDELIKTLTTIQNTLTAVAQLIAIGVVYNLDKKTLAKMQGELAERRAAK